MPVTNLKTVFIVMFASFIMIFFERAFPFLLFSKKEAPKAIKFVEQFIPPIVMGALLIYCLKDIHFNLSSEGFLPSFLGLLCTSLLHLWKHNSLLSIFSGTAVYMLFYNLM